MFKAIFVWSRIGNPDMHCIPNSRFRHGNLIYGRCSISANDSPVNLQIHLFVQGAQSNAIHILVHHLIVNCFSTELPRSWKQYYLSFYNSPVYHISVINLYLLKIKIHTNDNFDLSEYKFLVFVFSAFSSSPGLASTQLYLSAFSNVASVYLGYILYFILKDICIVCLSTYITNAVLLVAVYYKNKSVQEIKQKKERKKQKWWKW